MGGFRDAGDLGDVAAETSSVKNSEAIDVAGFAATLK